ncbi:MAG: hypothetical protein KIT72_15120 [Polyangiaceae bacterium]|nr:hypothetical protein [Polyangiaceae bacterium]MCW5791747.1 hypothetical protein [Polyangiaceae bacterium]
MGLTQELLGPVNIQSEIDALERLAALDAVLAQIAEQLAEKREALQALLTEREALTQRLTRDRSAVADMDRQRSESVGELRQMSMQVERAREKLARCRTEREANAVQRELEEMRQQQRDREVEIQKLDNLGDQARSDIAATEQKLAELTEQLGSTEGDTSAALADLEQRQSEAQGERQGVVKGIKPQLYRKYELIRQRRGGAIASTTDGKCSACHILLPPMMFQTLRRGSDMDQCPSCQRIIYFKPQVAAEADAESEG